MRIIQTTLALILAVSLLPLPCPAADGASVHALLISASNQKGGSDPKLATHESTLRRNLPFDTFRLTGEGSASVAAGGRASLSLGRGHRLELQSEKGGLRPPFGGDYSDFSVPLGRTRPIDGFCTTTSVPAAISTVT